MNRRWSTRPTQRGLSLVELLVAVALMLMVTAGTVALYTVNAGSSRTVDASQSLDDTARFVFEVVGQAIRNAGYPGMVPEEMDEGGASLRTVANLFNACTADSNKIPCPILGFDNKKIKSIKDGAMTTSNNGYNNSDVLSIRFNGASSGTEQRTTAEGNSSLITCTGRPVGSARTDDELGWVTFWVKELSGEPELYCHEKDNQNQPLARGVESFQVMYGLDCQESGCSKDGMPDRWVNANDVGSGNWPFVRAVRIGLILRGPPGSSQATRALQEGEDESILDLYPLGKGFNPNVKITPPKDGRLRRVYISTFMLRNAV